MLSTCQIFLALATTCPPPPSSELRNCTLVTAYIGPTQGSEMRKLLFRDSRGLRTGRTGPGHAGIRPRNRPPPPPPPHISLIVQASPALSTARCCFQRPGSRLDNEPLLPRIKRLDSQRYTSPSHHYLTAWSSACHHSRASLSAWRKVSTTRSEKDPTGKPGWRLSLRVSLAAACSVILRRLWQDTRPSNIIVRHEELTLKQRGTPISCLSHS